MDEPFETIDDAVEAFMKSEPEIIEDEPREDDEQASEVESVETEEVEAEEVDDEGDDEPDADEGEEGGEEEPSTADPDDVEVSVSVDGKDHKVKVKDLKRLYGQEAALTQKSQAVSNQIRAVEAQGLYLANVLDARVKQAEAQYNKYKDVDLWKANRELDADEFEALKAAKEASEAEYRVVTAEAQQFLRNAQETKQKFLREQAKQSLVVLQKQIPDWSDELYGKVRGYAVSQGMDADTVNEIVDASAIVMMHKAMLYDQAQAGKAKVMKKVAKAPASVVRKSDKPTDTASVKIKRIRASALETGDVTDVAELFLANSKK